MRHITIIVFLFHYMIHIGLMHIGVVKTLHETHLLPRIISGSSCGSIIAAMLCTRTDEEIPAMMQFENFNCVSFFEYFIYFFIYFFISF
jgi:hypothetical protein